MGKGWLFKMKIADRSQVEALMDEPAYRTLIDSAEPA
jgi:glycine cleavage system H lipoate-binding protein